MFRIEAYNIKMKSLIKQDEIAIRALKKKIKFFEKNTFHINFSFFFDMKQVNFYIHPKMFILPVNLIKHFQKLIHIQQQNEKIKKSA